MREAPQFPSNHNYTNEMESIFRIVNSLTFCTTVVSKVVMMGWSSEYAQLAATLYKADTIEVNITIPQIPFSRLLRDSTRYLNPCIDVSLTYSFSFVHLTGSSPKNGQVKLGVNNKKGKFYLPTIGLKLLFLFD